MKEDTFEKEIHANTHTYMYIFRLLPRQSAKRAEIAEENQP